MKLSALRDDRHRRHAVDELAAAFKSRHLSAVRPVDTRKRPRVRGGHFLAGKVRPTLEVTIDETASKLRRKKRADLGIALIDI